MKPRTEKAQAATARCTKKPARFQMKHAVLSRQARTACASCGTCALTCGVPASWGRALPPSATTRMRASWSLQARPRASSPAGLCREQPSAPLPLCPCRVHACMCCQDGMMSLAHAQMGSHRGPPALRLSPELLHALSTHVCQAQSIDGHSKTPGRGRQPAARTRGTSRHAN